jgi:membrane protease YdiL (CAAX protease family)
VLFSAAHLPNLVLVAATVVAAVFFVSVFQRWRNIYPLAIAHAMLGLSLAASVPDPVLRHMRVGIGFLHFVR